MKQIIIQAIFCAATFFVCPLAAQGQPKKEYFEDGKTVKLEYTLVNGKKEGPGKTYYKNGKLFAEYTFKNGLVNGRLTTYDKYGELETSGIYIDDKPEGEQLNYNYGKLEERLTARAGVPHGEYFKYFKDGTVKEKGTYIDGKKNGEWISYYDDGKIQGKENWKDDKEDGDFISYHRNGKVSTKGRMNKGELIERTFKAYNEDGSEMSEEEMKALVDEAMNGF